MKEARRLDQHKDRVQLFPLEHLPVEGVHAWNAVPGRHGLRPLADEVADRDHLDVLHIRQRGEVHVPRNAPRADHTDLKFVGFVVHISLPCEIQT